MYFRLSWVGQSTIKDLQQKSSFTAKKRVDFWEMPIYLPIFRSALLWKIEIKKIYCQIGLKKSNFCPAIWSTTFSFKNERRIKGLYSKSLHLQQKCRLLIKNVLLSIRICNRRVWQAISACLCLTICHLPPIIEIARQRRSIQQKYSSRKKSTTIHLRNCNNSIRKCEIFIIHFKIRRKTERCHPWLQTLWICSPWCCQIYPCC